MARGQTSTRSPRPTPRAMSGSPGSPGATATSTSPPPPWPTTTPGASRGRSPRARRMTGARPSPPTARAALPWAWDTYDRGQYDVRLRFVGSDARRLRADGRRRDPALSKGGPALTFDAKGRLWIAYEEGDEQWGKDYSNSEFAKIGHKSNPGFALYINRTARGEVPGRRDAPGALGRTRSRPGRRARPQREPAPTGRRWRGRTLADAPPSPAGQRGRARAGSARCSTSTAGPGRRPASSRGRRT